jgi:hypothetical protein
MKKKVLVGCEESQIITKAFRARGIEAFSCDIKPCSGGHPEWHIQMDLFEAVKLFDWALMIVHPPCTFLSSSGAKWYYHPEDKHLPTNVRRPHPLYPNRAKDRDDAVDFFMRCVNAPVNRIVIENPIGRMSSFYRKPDQIIQPWQFGHGETKATCLWLKNVPKLQPTNIVEGREQRMFRMAPSKDRQALRSKTYEGIAEAFANQYENLFK